MYNKCTMLNDHVCKLCNKNYASRQSLWNHNNKYHLKITIEKSLKSNSVGSSKSNSKSVTESVHNDTSEYHCRHCDKVFKYKQGRWNYEQKCKNKLSSQEIIELKKELTEGIKEIEKIKKQLVSKKINYN